MSNIETLFKGIVLFLIIILIFLGIFSGEDLSQIISSTIFVLIISIFFFKIFELKKEKTRKQEKEKKNKISKNLLKKASFKKINRKEMMNFMLAVIIMAFLFSFNDWPDLKKGLINYLTYLIIVSISFFIYETCMRIFSKKLDIKSEYELRPNMIFLSFFITIITNGNFPFFLVGYHKLKLLTKERLGYKFESIQRKEKAIIAFKSIGMSLLLAIILSFFKTNPLIQKAMIFNILFSIYNLIPWPPTDGSLMLYRMGGAWVFLFFGSIGLLLTIRGKNLFFSLFLTLLFVLINYIILKKTEKWIG